MIRRLILALSVLCALAVPARAAFDMGELICETTTTTGTGTVNLAGAVSNYVTFVSQIASGSVVPYHILASDGKREAGIGTFTDATPDTLSRTATWSTDGSGAELTLPSGTHTVCLGPIAGIWTGVTAWDFSTTTTGTVTTGSIELGDASDTTIDDGVAGEATLEGDAIKHAGKQGIFIPAAACTPNVTSPAGYLLYDSGSNDLSVVTADFDTGATEERIDCSVALPKAWNESTVTASFYWTNTGGASSSVAWEIGCAGISDDDTLNTTMGTTQIVVDAWIATNDLHISAETSAITCGGTPAANDLVQIRINRDTSNASDAMAGDARLIGFKLFYTDDQATNEE